MMDAKELTKQLEQYAVYGGYPYQYFHDGLHFIAREVEGGFQIALNIWVSGLLHQTKEQFVPYAPGQAVMIRTALELMREYVADEEPLQHFASANALAAALESSVDRAFPGSNYSFGYLYREAWTFEGKDIPEGLEVWLNFQFDGDFKQTSSYVLPNAFTKRELTGWTKTIMNEAFTKR